MGQHLEYFLNRNFVYKISVIRMELIFNKFCFII